MCSRAISADNFELSPCTSSPKRFVIGNKPRIFRILFSSMDDAVVVASTDVVDVDSPEIVGVISQDVSSVIMSSVMGAVVIDVVFHDDVVTDGGNSRVIQEGVLVSLEVFDVIPDVAPMKIRCAITTDIDGNILDQASIPLSAKKYIKLNGFHEKSFKADKINCHVCHVFFRSLITC